MTTPANAAPEPAPAPARRRWLRVPTLGQAAAIVGLIGSVVGLLFIFKPGWKPQPPPEVGTVEFSDIHPRLPVTFKRYLQRLNLPVGTMSPEQLRRKGVLIEFHARIVGFKKRELPLRWELNEASTDDLVAQDQAIAIVPSTNDEGRTWFVWAPAPKTKRSYYITVTLYQPKKGQVAVPLASFDSPRFRGLARQ